MVLQVINKLKCVAMCQGTTLKPREKGESRMRIPPRLAHISTNKIELNHVSPTIPNMDYSAGF